jgi:hypothetical protein
MLLNPQSPVNVTGIDPLPDRTGAGLRALIHFGTLSRHSHSQPDGSIAFDR